MTYQELEEIFNKFGELKFRLYGLEYMIKTTDLDIEIFEVLYPSKKKVYKSFKEVMDKFKVYNEPLIDILDSIIIQK